MFFHAARGAENRMVHVWDFLVAYPHSQDSTFNPACFSSTVPGLHAGEGAERNRVHTGCLCQNEGKAQTKTPFCVIVCTLGPSLFGEPTSFTTQLWISYKRFILTVFFRLLSVSCYHVFSHSLSCSLCSYLTLSSSAAAVWGDILIFLRSPVLLYLRWHVRGPLIIFLPSCT